MISLDDNQFYTNKDNNNIFSTNTSGLKYNNNQQTDFSDKYSGRDYYEGTKNTDQSGVYLDLSGRQNRQAPVQQPQPVQPQPIQNSQPIQNPQQMNGASIYGSTDNSRFARPQNNISQQPAMPAQSSVDPSYSRGQMGEYRRDENLTGDIGEYRRPGTKKPESIFSDSHIDQTAKSVQGQGSDDKLTESVVEEKRPAVKERKKGKLGFLKLTAAALLFGVVAGGSFYGVNALLGSGKNEKSNTESTSAKSNAVIAQQVSDVSSSAGTMNYDVAQIAADAQPSIVSITTTVTTTYQYYFQEFEQESTGAGSGIIIGKSDEQLYIATNYHVIEGATEINVGFCDGEIVKARVKGYDASADIAVVTVDFSDLKDSTAEAIKIAAVGNSDELVVGEPVIAIGNALGYGQSVTVGYISALDRQIQNRTGSFIQTDAAINPGNSGGALINSKGQVIGINSIKYVNSKVEGVGFSIPSNRAMSIIENIIEGKDGKTYLGTTGADISKEYAQIYGFPEGIYVKSVESSSPAYKAGIHTGDIIVEFGGKSVYTDEELQKLIEAHKEGDKVGIVVYRADDRGNYKKVELEVELGFSVNSDD